MRTARRSKEGTITVLNQDLCNVEDITRLNMSNHEPVAGTESIESVRKGYNQVQFLNTNNSVDRVQEGNQPIMLNKIDKSQ